MKGPSSAGKNDVVRRVLRFFRPAVYFERTGLTTKALYYSTESFSHRVLVLFEANNLREGELAGIVRSLLSEGRLVYEFTDFEARRTELIDKPGPTGLLTTTALVALDRELETRLVSIQIADTPEQTRAVMLAIAAEEQQDQPPQPDYGVWRALDEWLATQARRARVPFAGQLARLADASAVRMRRDFTAILAVVRAHALLHQASRERDPDGAVRAEPADYRAAWELLSESVAEAAERAVPDTVREVVAAAQRLLEGSDEESVTIRQLAGALGLDDSAVRRRVYKALDLGYLTEIGRGRGRARLLAPGDPLPEDRGALPTPDELTAACTHARTTDEATSQHD